MTYVVADGRASTAERSVEKIVVHPARLSVGSTGSFVGSQM